jgi:2-oxoglutarate ferredoxin oxidoreductase subunit beta
MGDPVTMMKWLRDSAVPIEKARKMTPGSLKNKFSIGVLADVKKPIYTEEYQKIREKAQRSLKELGQ